MRQKGEVMKYKRKLKSELAECAGVSQRTFYRWLQRNPHKSVLQKYGVTAKTKYLTPAAVRYLCETFCIDLNDSS